MRMGFIGDTSFSGVFANADAREDCWRELGEILRLNDYNIVNLEGPLTSSPSQKKTGISLQSDPSCGEVLHAIGTNVLNLANNHLMDCGSTGLEDTLTLAAKHRWQTFGAGHSLEEASRELVLAGQGKEIALLGVTHKEGMVAGDRSPGVFSDHPHQLVRSRLQDLKAKHDWVILNYHGGEEFTFLPMPRRRKLLQTYLEWGADIVVAHHSHVVQGFETHGNKAIFYSLGNFVFDIKPHHHREGTDASVILILEFGRNSFDFHPVFTHIDRFSGKVQQAPDDERFRQISDFGYHKEWHADCYRLWFGGRVSSLSASQQLQSPQHHQLLPSNWKRLLRCRTYRSIAKILTAQNTRPIAVGAAMGLLRRKLKWD